MAISDKLKPKLIYEDEDEFENALSSVFNDCLQGEGSNINEQSYQASLIKEENLRNEIKQIIDIKKLTGRPFLVNQVVQLHNNMLLKHGLMLVGDSLSGKTTTLKLLQALNKRKVSSNPNNTYFSEVEIRTIFPKKCRIRLIVWKNRK